MCMLAARLCVGSGLLWLLGHMLDASATLCYVENADAYI